MFGISVPVKETPESSLIPSTTRRHSRKALLHTRKQALSRHQICCHFDLRLLSLQNWRNKCFLFISHPIYGIFVIAAWLVPKHSPKCLWIPWETKDVSNIWTFPSKPHLFGLGTAVIREEPRMGLDWPGNTSALVVTMVWMFASSQNSYWSSNVQSWWF